MATKKLFALIALNVLAVLLTDCSPKTGKATSSGGEKTGGTAAVTTDGKTIYTANCGKCHTLYDPTDKTVEKWNKVLPAMIRKAKLSETEGEAVRAYVMANVKK